METTNLLTFLVNSLWQAPLVTTVAALAVWIMRRAPAGHRHAVWVAALAGALLVPLASVRIGSRSVTPVYPLAATALPAIGAAGTSTAPAPPSPESLRKAMAAEPIMVPFAARTARVLVSAYACFLLFRLALLALAWMRTARIRRAARRCVVSQQIENIWTRCRRVFSLERVELLASAAVPGPLMAGAWRRSVIIPDSLLAETSEDVLLTAIGHELAHAKRHDFFVNLLCELLYIPISFNPVAWIVRRGIERTREMACDEMVAARLLNPGAYARSIVRLAAGMMSPAHPGYTLGVFDGDILEERIRRLMERRAGGLRQARLLLVAVLSALAVCAVVASGLALSARAQSAARPELIAGVQAFNAGDFQGAVQHFETAVQLEPANVLAKLHLANAYTAAAHDRTATGAQGMRGLQRSARQQYEDALSLDPSNRSAILGLVSLSGPDELPRSRERLQRLIAAEPGDATAYYYMAVQDWSYSYPRIQQALKAADSSLANPFLPDAALRRALQDQVKPQLEEGARMLQTALQLDPGSGESLAYLNLMYRSLAVIAETPAQSQELIAKAEDAVRQTFAARQGPEVEVDSPPSLASAMRAVPPPPPPPPPPGYHGPPGVPMPPRPDSAFYWEVAVRETGATHDTAQAALDKLRGLLGFPAGIMHLDRDKFDHIVVGPYKDGASLRDAKTKLEALGFQPKLR